MKICDYCGRENSDEATHCRECGTPFELERAALQASRAEVPKTPVRAAAERKMLSGAITCIVGILITFFTYLHALQSPFGGTYVVAWGAILFGGIRFVRGLTERDNPQTVEDDGYNALSRATKLEGQGQVQEALVLYQQIAEKFPDTGAGQDAKKSIESIHARRGESQIGK